ncbi:hypothetical protein H7I41_25485 [Mycobacterium manitobense]|uniref:Uncharacterized protein n=1 Tax=[Mycobacterium] manitobense TaxID=190147 RepID=A0A9X3BQL3_9MYCO|nr:hypothetical protein [[Mycobacterium] manitobense]MCV7173280.1 hypothetical protein [[Mycobacterium] manitobense]
MVVDTLAAAGPNGESGSFGLLLVMLAIAVIGLLPMIAVLVGSALLVAGFIRRSAYDRRLAHPWGDASPVPSHHSVGPAPFGGVPPRQGDGTVLLVIGGFLAALGLLGLAAFALI